MALSRLAYGLLLAIISLFRKVCVLSFLEEAMNYSLLANRRVWFVLGFVLLLLLAVFYALTETALGATLNIQMYLPIISNIKLGGTIP